MADEIVEIVSQGETVEVVTPEPTTVIEIDAGGTTGPRGPTGPAGMDGAQGPQGPQGRFIVNIFQRAETFPTTAPMGGTFNIATGELTPPADWFDSPSGDMGTGDLVQSRASIDPAVQSGVVTPTWSLPFEAGGTGPAGQSGDDIILFYADDAAGTNATLTYAQQPFAAFVLYTAGTTAPTTPPADATWVRIQGQQGDMGLAGQSIVTFYADDASGTGATTTYTDQGFVAFVIYESGTTPPTAPPAGTVWLRFEGPSGLGIPYLTASSIPAVPQDLVADTAYHIRVTNLTNTDLPTAVALVIDNLSVPSGELDISRGVPSGDTEYFTWTPIQATINTIRNNFGSRTALDVVLRFGNPPSRVEVTIVDDVADRLQTNTTYDLSAEGSSTQNAADIRLSGSDSSTDNVTIAGAGGTTVARTGNTITITGGGGPGPHANLVTGFGISPVSTVFGTPATVTGTPTATIRDAASGDAVNSVRITSAHSTVRNNTVNVVTGGAGTNRDNFTWASQAADAVQTITFTCSFTVNYTIDNATMEHSFTDTAQFRVVAAPVLFWSGTITTAQLGMLSTLTDAQIQSFLLQMENFSSPFSAQYVGSGGNLHPAIYVPESQVITNVVSEGFILNVDSQNIASASRTIYATRFPLTAGTHTVTWRTS